MMIRQRLEPPKCFLTALALLILAPTVLAGSHATSPPNIILIAVDTLRPDRLGCYGYSRTKTPNIDGLAEDGVLFRNTIAQVPLTLPSFCSMMTGTYPLFHGVRDFSYGFLPQDRTTLAEVLKSRSYVTGAFIGSFVLDTRFGLDQGFDHYDGKFDLKKYQDIDPGTIQRRGDHVVREANQWIQTNKNKRLFAWIHLYDPHHPYDPPEPYRSQYRTRPYDGEVAYTDFLIGQVLGLLKATGLYDESLIVLTSDHGEGLGEHDEATHGFFVYDSTLKVPLIIKTPQNDPAGKVIEAQVRSVDIMPTILQYASVQTPSQVQGIGLRSLIEGKVGQLGQPYAYSENFYAHSAFGWSPLRTLRTRRHKFVLAPQPELYDLREDPLETHDIHQANQVLANTFTRDLMRLEQRYSAGGRAKPKRYVDPAVIGRLKALGYVDYTEPTPAERIPDYFDLSDPKDKIGLFNAYMRAQDYSQVGKQQESIELLKELIQLDPNIHIALHTLTNRYLRAGHPKLAMKVNQEVLERNPDSEAAAFNLGKVYSRLNRLQVEPTG